VRLFLISRTPQRQTNTQISTRNNTSPEKQNLFYSRGQSSYGRFKQGSGRLIQYGNDKNMYVDESEDHTDSRVIDHINKPFGHRYTPSMPQFQSYDVLQHNDSNINEFYEPAFQNNAQTIINQGNVDQLERDMFTKLGRPQFTHNSQ